MCKYFLYSIDCANRLNKSLSVTRSFLIFYHQDIFAYDVCVRQCAVFLLLKRPSQTVASTLGAEWTAATTRLLFRGREMTDNNATLEVKKRNRGGRFCRALLRHVGV